VYFGEQISVLRPSGRVVPSSEPDLQSSQHETSSHETDAFSRQNSDPLAHARRQAQTPFLPYSSWLSASYHNLETKMSSNDPFETAATQSDPRTRFLVQFESLQMTLLQHPEFDGVEPLFGTAFVFSTGGKNSGRRVRKRARTRVGVCDVCCDL